MPRRPATPAIAINSGDQASRVRTHRFGTVEVRVAATDAAAAKDNIAKGQTALARAAGVIVKRGVSLRHGKHVPLFSVDPKHPEIVIRKFEGRQERGHFRNGTFIPSE